MLLALALGLLAGAQAYLSPAKEHFFSDVLLREVVDRMGKDLADAADAYLDFPDSRRSSKDIETEEQLYPGDYENLGEGNLRQSIRDQEFLQHSSLWGNQYMSGGAGEGKQRLKPEGSLKNRQEIKTDASLPAYCNPPNPCPIGYEEDQGCIKDFENTAAYSRRYQGEQDCMCDSEHMFDCPRAEEANQEDPMEALNDIEFNRFLQHTMKNDGGMKLKNLSAKKFHPTKNENENPFLTGERLPVAAKKGTHVHY